MSEAQFKKVDVRLLQQLVEVIATSNTQLTYVQQQELFKAVGECEDVEVSKTKPDAKDDTITAGSEYN